MLLNRSPDFIIELIGGMECKIVVTIRKLLRTVPDREVIDGKRWRKSKDINVLHMEEEVIEKLDEIGRYMGRYRTRENEILFDMDEKMFNLMNVSYHAMILR